MSKTQGAPASTALATLPAGFGEIALPSAPEGSRVPYIQFASTKSKNYSSLLQKIPTLREGEAVLICPEPALPQKLEPLRFFLLSASEFWAQYSETGEMLGSSATKPDEPKAKPKWDQTIEAAVLVILPDRLVPAQVRFKTTKCPAVTKAMFTAHEATTKGWAAKGPEYALTMRCDQPWARFYTHAERKEKPNRETNRLYQTMEAQIHPSTAVQFELLKSFFSDEANTQLLNDVAASYRKRVEAAKRKELVVA